MIDNIAKIFKLIVKKNVKQDKIRESRVKKEKWRQSTQKN